MQAGTYLLSTAYTPTRIMGILAGDEEQSGVTQDTATVADGAAADNGSTDAAVSDGAVSDSGSTDSAANGEGDSNQ